MCEAVEERKEIFELECKFAYPCITRVALIHIPLHLKVNSPSDWLNPVEVSEIYNAVTGCLLNQTRKYPHSQAFDLTTESITGLEEYCENEFEAIYDSLLRRFGRSKASRALKLSFCLHFTLCLVDE